MFFKNVFLFQLTCPAADVITALKKKIDTAPFTPCTKDQATSLGFVSPWEDDPQLWTEQSGIFMVRLKHQVKQIPASGVAEMVQDKVKVIEADQGRKCYKKERQALKDEIVLALIPTAIPVSKFLTAYIDTRLNMLVIDSGSAAQAELVCGSLRDVIGSLPLLIPSVKNDPSRTMTKWMHSSKYPTRFKPGGCCKLEDPAQEGSTITIKNDDLDTEAIDGLLDDGRVVEALQVIWKKGDVVFTLATPHILKAMHFSEQLISGAMQDGEDEKARLEADLALMADTLCELVPDVGKVFGGWNEQQFLDLAGED